MSISINDFWKLAIGSRLVSRETGKQWFTRFLAVPGAAQRSNAPTLAEWLVAEGLLTRYQVNFLLAGQPGPFVFGQYTVSEKIEAGRLAELFRARHFGNSQSVLLYFLNGAALQDRAAFAEVVRQTEAARPLVQPNLARVWELVDESPYKFVVIEDLPGCSLQEAVAGRRLPPGEACRIVREAALGVARLHEAGQAHGALRPQNLWREPSGRIKVLGFPLARDPLALPIFNPHDSSPAGQAALEYMAPEMAHSGRMPDVLTDVYALGATLYELLSGAPPFAGGDPSQKLARHASEAIRPLDPASGVTPELMKVVAYMMAKNARIRLQTVATVAEALAPFAAAGGELASAAPAGNAAVSAANVGGGNGIPAARPQAMPLAPAPVATNYLPAGAAAPAAIPVGRAAPAAVPMGAVAPAAAPAAAAPRPAAARPAASAAPPVDVTPEAAPPVAPQADLAAVLPKYLATNRSTRQAPKKFVVSKFMVASCVAGLVLVIGAMYMALRKRPDPPPIAAVEPYRDPFNPTGKKPPEEEPEEEPTETKTPDESSKKPKDTAATEEKLRELDDDGKSLWTSPTAGPAIDLTGLPAGCQTFVILRPAEILAHPEGAKVLAALGPGGELAKAKVEALIGQKLTDIEQLIVGFYPSESSDVQQTAFVVRLTADSTEDALLSAWKQPGERNEGGKRYFAGSEWAYYIPSGQARMFSVVATRDVKEVVTMDGPPPVQKMALVLRDTDALRHFTLLMNPNSIFTLGKTLFVGNLERLREPLKAFMMQGDVPAAELSMHLGDNFFVELRALGGLDLQPIRMAETYRTRLSELPAKLASYLESLSLQKYSQNVLRKFDVMVGTLVEFTRIGEENNQAVLRCYLPVHAGHNLLMGSELALAERPGPATAVASKGPAPAAVKKPSGPAEALLQKTSLSFPRDTLEKSTVMLSEAIETEIVIIGADLQLDGITKNQSFGLDERDKPATEILQTIMKKANVDGKLIYVIKPKEAGGKDIIFITTRAAAEKRGDKIPPELQLKDAPKKK